MLGMLIVVVARQIEKTEIKNCMKNGGSAQRNMPRLLQTSFG